MNVPAGQARGAPLAVPATPAGLAGGGESVTRILRGLGVTGMVVATSEAEMAWGDAALSASAP
jgi:hypothetical protein